AALADLDRALAAAPESTEARLARAEVRLDWGDFAGVVADASAVLARNPDDFGALRLRSRAYVMQRLGRQALMDFERMLRLHPKYLPAVVGRAAAFSILGRDAEARQALDEGLGRLPDAGPLLTTRALFR